MASFDFDDTMMIEIIDIAKTSDAMTPNSGMTTPSLIST